MWKKQAQNEHPKHIDFEAKKNNKPIWRGQSKYVILKNQKICWQCGKRGHLKQECWYKKVGYYKPNPYPNTYARKTPRKKVEPVNEPIIYNRNNFVTWYWKDYKNEKSATKPSKHKLT